MPPEHNVELSSEEAYAATHALLTRASELEQQAETLRSLAKRLQSLNL